MYVRGAGRTKFGILNSSIPEMVFSAIIKALEDGDMAINEIDAIVVSNFLGGPLQGQLHSNGVIASLLPGYHIPIIRVETACASGGTAFHQGVCLLNNYKNIMAVGFEKMNGETRTAPVEALAMAEDFHYDYERGLIFPAAYALIAQQYLTKYSVSHTVLEKIAYNNHINANLNPDAHYYEKTVSMETIRKSKMVSSPLTLFDCSPLSDGAVALILSNQRYSDRDVSIESCEMSSDTISLTQRNDLTSFQATKIAAKKAYCAAKISPRDIDLVEVHDCFTISELIALEDLGLCAAGESPMLIENDDFTLDGLIPVNTDGGLKANGHPVGATGLAQIFEIVTQIRCEAGKRQIKHCEVGVCQNIGGIGATSVVTVLKG